MAIYNDIGKAEAMAELAVARAIGVSVLWSHEGAADVSLYASVLSDANRIEDKFDHRRQVEAGELTLVIPVQTGLSVQSGVNKPIVQGDVITYNGRRYVVSGDIDVQSNGYVFIVRLREDRSHTVGVKS